MSQRDPLKKFISDFYKLRRQAETLGLANMKDKLAIAANFLGDDICQFKIREIWREKETPAPSVAERTEP